MDKSQIQSKHLSILTSEGRNYINHVLSAANLLEADYLGEISLSDTERKEFFMMIKNSAEKHLELIIWSITERDGYSDSEV